MHIAMWSPAWPLEQYQNGIVTYVHWMKRELEQRGHRVSVFTDARYAGSSNDSDVHFVRPRLRDRLLRRIADLGRPIEFSIFDYSAVISAGISSVHRRDPIDVIEMEESFGWFADVKRRTSIPVLVKLHGPAFLSMVEGELDTPLVRERIEREGEALRLASAIVSPSKLTLAQTLERYRLAPKIQGHIVNPVTMNEEAPIWDLDRCDRNTILFVGRFDLRKGADVALKAFALLLKDRHNLKLIFVGPDEGLPASGGAQIRFDAYRELLFSAEDRARIDFRGRMANHEIAKLRTQTMLTVVASRWENQGYALLEAMLQGCPVVSTDAGGCPESVTHGVTGLLAKSEDPGDFAIQMRAMLDDPMRAKDMGHAARQHVIEQHSAATVAALALDAYQRVISSGAG